VLHAPAGSGKCQVRHYRAYVIGRDGHFIKSIDLSCADHSAAVESAKQLIDGHDIELWQGDRKIAKFDGNPKMQP
jgi:hypothetical protein